MHKKGIIAGGVVGVLSSVGIVLAGSNVSATVTCGDPNSAGVSTCTDSETDAVTYKSSSSATASVTVTAACSFSRNSGSSGEYSGILANNASTEITGSTFTTICNDPGGYAIYAVGYGNNTLGETDLISANGSSNITTSGSPASGASYWQMKLTASTDNQPVLDNGYNNYSAIPSTYTKVASYSSITDPASSSTRTGQAITAHYKAYASSTQPADTYTGAVKYTMVHPGTIPTPVLIIDDLEYMQDFATLTNTEKTSVLNSMEAETTYTLKDKRDEQEYTMAKLKDGKVWMTKNLNLAGGTVLSADDTDVDSSYISSFTTSNNLTKTNDTLVLPASAAKNADNNNLTDSTQFSTDNYAYVFNSSNTTNCGDSGQNTPCYSYYSWDAATLGSGRGISTDNTDAQYSICPKGWKLPTSRTTSAANWQTEPDFYVLAHQYGLDSTTSTSESDNGFYTQAGPDTVPNFLLAGDYGNGSFSNGGSVGGYWSSTSYSSSGSAQYLGFSSSSVNSAKYGSRGYGISVRCLVAE